MWQGISAHDHESKERYRADVIITCETRLTGLGQLLISALFCRGQKLIYVLIFR